MNKILLFTIFILLVLSAKAQDIKVSSATQQRWAGGVCCRSGIYYDFVLEFSNSKENINIDTIYIGNRFFTESNTNPYNLTRTIKDGKVILNIKINLVINNRIENTDIDREEIKPRNDKNVPVGNTNYARIVYCIDFTRYEIIVENFTELEMIAYP